MTKHLFLGLVLLSGCWAGGHLRYRDEPALVNVRLATGAEKGEPEGQLGVVTADARGYASCDQLVTQVMRDLLAEARAVGGTRVEQVKFKRRWHWSGREALCHRNVLLRKSTRARGYAVR
jgi:hypothetical protein